MGSGRDDGPDADAVALDGPVEDEASAAMAAESDWLELETPVAAERSDTSSGPSVSLRPVPEDADTPAGVICRSRDSAVKMPSKNLVACVVYCTAALVAWLSMSTCLSAVIVESQIISASPSPAARWLLVPLHEICQTPPFTCDTTR
jgi:hypothetical protein